MLGRLRPYVSRLSGNHKSYYSLDHPLTSPTLGGLKTRAGHFKKVTNDQGSFTGRTCWAGRERAAAVGVGGARAADIASDKSSTARDGGQDGWGVMNERPVETP